MNPLNDKHCSHRRNVEGTDQRTHDRLVLQDGNQGDAGQDNDGSETQPLSTISPFGRSFLHVNVVFQTTTNRFVANLLLTFCHPKSALANSRQPLCSGERTADPGLAPAN